MLSQKLNNYINHVINKTQKEIIVINYAPCFEEKIPGCFFEDCKTHIKIAINQAVLENEDDYERIYAHEITHGFFRYSKGYPGIQIINGVDPPEDKQKQICKISSLIENIPVNKYINEHGFPPFNSDYLQNKQNEIFNYQIGNNVRNDLSESEYFDLVIAQYVTAWGYFEYFDLDPELKNMLLIYLTCIDGLDGYDEKQIIISYIKQNNIFTPDGYKLILNNCMKLYQLDNIFSID